MSVYPKYSCLGLSLLSLSSPQPSTPWPPDHLAQQYTHKWNYTKHTLCKHTHLHIQIKQCMHTYMHAYTQCYTHRITLYSCKHTQRHKHNSCAQEQIHYKKIFKKRSSMTHAACGKVKLRRNSFVATCLML